MTKVLAFDLDGTLINNKNEVIGGEKTLKLLDKIKKLGFELVITTGRLDHDIYYINEKYGLDIKYRISQNGAVIQDKISSKAMLLDKKEAIRLYKNLIEKFNDIRIELNTVSNRYWHSERDPDFPKEYYDSSAIKKDFSSIIKFQPIVLFLLIGDNCRIDSVQKYINENYEKFDAIKTSETSLEILKTGISKGNTLRKLFPDSKIISIGDSDNDYSMFEQSVASYYVGPDPKGAMKAKYNVLDIHEALVHIYEEEKNND